MISEETERKEYLCGYCENSFEIVSESEEEIDFCPFCGEYLPEEEEEELEDLDFEED